MKSEISKTPGIECFSAKLKTVSYNKQAMDSMFDDTLEEVSRMEKRKPPPEVYEEQLNQLHAQLLEVMLDNEELRKQVDNLKSGKVDKRLQQELAVERSRTKTLQNKLKGIAAKLPKAPGSKSSMKKDQQQILDEWIELNSNEGEIDDAQEVREEQDVWRVVIGKDEKVDAKGESSQTSKQRGIWATYSRVRHKLLELYEDFTVTRVEDAQDDEEEELSPKRLRDNVKRFRDAWLPTYETIKQFTSVFSWVSPINSLLIFLLFMFAVWKGWVLTVAILLFLVKLSINYITYKPPLAMDDLSEDSQTFCSQFNLPPQEHPLSAWKGGHSVVLVDREKPFRGNWKYGKLYLTRSFLCFDRTKKGSEDVIIPLKDITKVEKAKPIHWLPGSGFAIEVYTKKFDKPLMFGGLVHRDEYYDSIMRQGRVSGLPWATTAGASSQAPPSAPQDSGHASSREEPSQRENTSTPSTPTQTPRDKLPGQKRNASFANVRERLVGGEKHKS